MRSEAGRAEAGLAEAGRAQPGPAPGRAARHGAAGLRLAAYGLALAVLVADQLVKLWVIEGLRLDERRTVPVLPFANLTWVENRGVSMGMLDLGDGGRWVLVAVTAAIAAGIALWLWRERGRLDAAALALVLGGALGNIIDRMRFGYVVDFVHLYWRDWHFYVFNVGDAAITVGVALLLLRAFVARPRGPAAGEGQDIGRRP